MISFFIAVLLLLPEKCPFLFQSENQNSTYRVQSYLHESDPELTLSQLSYETPSEISREEAFFAMMKRLPTGSFYRIHREDPFIAEWQSEGVYQWVRIDSFPKEISLLIVAAPEGKSSILSPIFQKMLEDAKVASK